MLSRQIQDMYDIREECDRRMDHGEDYSDGLLCSALESILRINPQINACEKDIRVAEKEMAEIQKVLDSKYC